MSLTLLEYIHLRTVLSREKVRGAIPLNIKGKFTMVLLESEPMDSAPPPPRCGIHYIMFRCPSLQG